MDGRIALPARKGLLTALVKLHFMLTNEKVYTCGSSQAPRKYQNKYMGFQSAVFNRAHRIEGHSLPTIGQ